MARHLIQNAATGETRIVGDAALPFFPGFAIVDTYDDGIPPAVFYGAGEADLRYVNVTELSDPASAASVALRAAFVPRAQLALNPDMLIAGTITRDANGAATSAPVVWPDGSPGTYTADTVSTAFAGAVDAYHITYGSPVTKTYTQPAVTRDANGAVTQRPALTAA